MGHGFFLAIVGLVWGTLPSPMAGHKSIEFLGFAANERACAWRVEVRQPLADGSTDVYTLVRLIDVPHSSLLASFRDGPLRHLDRQGRHSPLPQARLRARNPEWARAAAASTWQLLRRRGRFSFVAQEFKDTLVRIAPDQGSTFDVEVGKKELLLHAAAGSPLGFTPVVRLFEGEMMELGHFVHAAAPGPEAPAPRAAPAAMAAGDGPKESPKGGLHATLGVYYSKTGRSIVALNTFWVPKHPELGSHEAAIMVTDPDDPIGAVGMGLLPMIEIQARGVYNEFKAMHPDQEKNFRTYIGKYF